MTLLMSSMVKENLKLNNNDSEKELDVKMKRSRYVSSASDIGRKRARTSASVYESAAKTAAEV